MCGIVGYIGKRQAQTVLFGCLSKLEYRGYDSSGIAIRGSGIKLVKDRVRVDALKAAAPEFRGSVGIGHTRWATHGAPSLSNAHPHLDCTGRIAVVHNGVITNYLSLKKTLISEGHIFRSETDTEVIPHLIDKYYEDDIVKAVELAISRLEGSYAIAVISEPDGRLIVARKESPLIIGLGQSENLIASDAPAIMEYTNRIMCLEDGDIAILTDSEIIIKNSGVRVERPVQVLSWSREDADKGGHEHYMLKEIREQPRILRANLTATVPVEARQMLEKHAENLLIIACGTSYHAGLLGKYLFEEALGNHVNVELASEFNYRNVKAEASAAILISQSGETADVLTSLKKLVNAGVPTLVITNVAYSTACRTANHAICTNAGPEVSVAATKSFTAQILTLYQMLLSTGNLPSDYASLNNDLKMLPALVQKVIDDDAGLINESARFLSKYNNVFFIGRGMNLPIALEGALKLKEISYIHAEGCAAGELKHGPLALMGEGTPVVAIVSQDRTYDAMMTNIKEVKARGSPVIIIANQDVYLNGLADRIIPVKGPSTFVSPVLNAVVLQLIAYHAARIRGCPIDFPRNLAKSVTVE